jgi:DNA-binding NtrC family response regulator
VLASTCHHRANVTATFGCWPGNLGELENVIERAVILQRGCTIAADHLALNTPDTDQQLPLNELENRLSLDEYFISFVKKYQPQYNETEIAVMLGISRRSLWENANVSTFQLASNN